MNIKNICRAADDRTKKVTSGNSTISYDYAGTRLNKIIFGTGENSESYSFTYDSFGNVLTHVSVRPVGATMDDWINAGSDSIWTQAVKSVAIKWEGAY